jgi:hypothetical protein
MWFGFYDNAFRLIRDIYKENARPLEKPMATYRADRVNRLNPKTPR